MYINGINGYLSKYEGTEVDAAVERVQGLDAELALKVDTSTTINGTPLENGSIVLTAESLGALPLDTPYGRSIKFTDDNILYLCDAQERVLSGAYLKVDTAEWGNIYGDLSEQSDLKEALDSKQPMITPSAMVSSDLIDDSGATHKFATADQLIQISTNTTNIARNATNIAVNATNIATNTADIATNTANIATNTADIATNAANITTNANNIAANTADIATNTNSISVINGKIPSQASSSNQLADKDFVNSSIATSTATFRGTFNSLADLEAYTGPKDDNDYAFVVTVDTAGNTLYNRYKYDGTQWLFEYTLNNSSFTAAEWASIQSGITASGVAQITTNKNDISTINNTLNTFGDIVTHDVSEFATAAQGAKADTALQSINSSMVTTALGYTPYNSTNPDGFISGITSSDVTTALGFTPYNSTNPAGYISGITSSDVTTALGYTPYNSTNPDGYISGITSSDVTTALGFTPYDSTNPDGYISGITSSDVTTALGFTPYNSTNPDGFISGITSSDVTTALGYTPYDSSNPSGYISSAALSTLTDVSLNSVSDGQHLVYDSTSQKWKNSSVVSLAWGNITGTLSDQTDLQSALNDKQDEITGAASTITTSDLTGGRVIISDSNGKIVASTITTAKLGYLSDVSSNIQVQINDKYDASNPSGYISSAAISTLTDVDLTNLVDGEFLKYDSSSGKWENSGIDLSKSLDDLTNVNITNPSQGQSLTYDNTSSKWVNTTIAAPAWGNITGTLSNQTDLQSALNGKQASITGAATTITSNDLTASRALVSDSSGKVAVSSITSIKLEYLTDVTSNIQAQINGKISSAAVSTLTDVTLSNLDNGQILAYDSTSQKWKNTSAAPGGATSLDGLTDVEITSPTQGQNLTYDSINNKWINSSSSATVGWGGIIGNIDDQTDLKNALDSKASVTFRDWSV